MSRKNPFTWLSAAMAVGGAVLLILSACMKDDITTVNIWFQTVLPVWASLGFAFIILVRGPKEFYRATKPFFWGCVYFGQVALDWYLKIRRDPSIVKNLGSGYALFGSMRYVVVCWILYLALYVVYRAFLTGKTRKYYILCLILLLPTAILTYDFIVECAKVPTGEMLGKLANVLILGSVFLSSLTMRPFADGLYHRCWGDRADGRRVRSLDPMSLVAGYIMPNRTGASNCIEQTFEISAVERYIHRKRAEGFENFGLMHVFLAGYVRTVCKYPGLNRFFSGQRVYQHGDDIAFEMTVKKEMSSDAPDTCIKLHLNRKDTAEEVYRKLNDLIEKTKNTPADSNFDTVAGILASIPGLFLKFTVWCLKVADYFGKVPKFLLEVSPFHGSVIFTSMGSLGIPPVVHHLYDFGNLPVFVAFGRKYRRNEIDSEGNLRTRRYVDLTMNCDERIVDGFYYATVLKYFQRLIRRPEQLDLPPEEIIDDIP